MFFPCLEEICIGFFAGVINQFIALVFRDLLEILVSTFLSELDEDVSKICFRIDSQSLPKINGFVSQEALEVVQFVFCRYFVLMG